MVACVVGVAVGRCVTAPSRSDVKSVTKSSIAATHTNKVSAMADEKEPPEDDAPSPSKDAPTTAGQVT